MIDKLYQIPKCQRLEFLTSLLSSQAGVSSTAPGLSSGRLSTFPTPVRAVGFSPISFGLTYNAGTTSITFLDTVPPDQTAPWYWLSLNFLLQVLPNGAAFQAGFNCAAAIRNQAGGTVNVFRKSITLQSFVASSDTPTYDETFEGVLCQSLVVDVTGGVPYQFQMMVNGLRINVE